MINFLGLYFFICLHNSPPIEPPPPVTKITLSFIPLLSSLLSGFTGFLPSNSSIKIGFSSLILDLPEVGNMSSTHSANPLSCAAGLAVIDELTNKNLIHKAHQKGIILFEGLNKLKYLFPNHITLKNCIFSQQIFLH